tara:strand:+ start:305 stop:574 length:270 start_codon:yes stop_codon:yes gene_type:complete
MKPQPDAYVFNEGRSRLILHYADINQAYIVYREDGTDYYGAPIQGNVKVHNEFSDAKADYDKRVKFIRQLEKTALMAELDAEELFGGDT